MHMVYIAERVRVSNTVCKGQKDQEKLPGEANAWNISKDK